MTEFGSQSLLPVEQMAVMSEARAQNIAETMHRTAHAIKEQRRHDQSTIMALQAALAEKEAEVTRSRNDMIALRMESEQALRTARNELADSRAANDDLRHKLATVSQHFETFSDHVSGLWNTIEQRHREFVSIEDRADAFFVQQDANQALDRAPASTPTARLEDFRSVLACFQTGSLAPAVANQY